MRVPLERRPCVQVDGIVRRVDPVGREVEVQAGSATVSFDVRPDCVVTLRGERVKLRLIQPLDQVRVTYSVRRGIRVADTVEVSNGGPTPG